MHTLISTFIPGAFLALTLAAQTLHAQCGNPTWVLNNDCGDIQAFGGLAPNQPTIFCAGQIVNVENNSSPAGEITATYIDWDDGICESFPGMPANLSHVYTFPTDTCYNGGLITFTVRMGVEKSCGTGNSFNFITFPVAVRFKPLVIITASDSSACTGSEISFSSAVCANGVVAYQWVIGGDTITSPDVPGYIFDNPGMYNVALTVTNACGQGGTAISITSAGPAEAVAAASANNVCAPDTVFFSNSSVNAAGQSWTITPGTGWAFVNGTDSLSAEPAVAFSAPGDYVVRLTVDGCGNPEWQETITVLAPPSLSIPAIPDGCDRQPYVYVPQATIGGTAPDVAWTFEGGSPATGTGPNPGAVAFSGIGQYVVSATVTVAGCGAVTQSDTFLITGLPTISLQPVADLCNSDPPLQLVATPAGNGWSGPGVSAGGLFSPGSLPDSLLNRPISLFFQTGTGDCLVRDTLVVQVNGQVVLAGPDLSLCLDAPAANLAGAPAGGSWSGNGVTAAGVFNPVAAGAGLHGLVYAVQRGACVSTDTVAAQVYALPTVALDSLPAVCRGTAIDFSATYSSTGASLCRWDFGDGSTSDTCSAVHTYPATGVYLVRLTVENAAGCRDTATGSVVVMPGPTAAFVTDRTEGCADLTVQINNQIGSYGALYIWDFGQGTLDTAEQPDPVVFGTGWYDTTYTIVLRAVNQCGAATQSQVITVHPLPQANFGANFSNGCSPLEVHFNSTTVGQPDFFSWFINGVPAGTDSQLPQQVFYANNQDSTHYITLVAGNECGTDTITQSILVKTNTVRAFFNTDTLSGCRPLPVRLTDYSTPGATVHWDLGDGNLATGDTVLHVYDQPGQYTIRAFAGNGCGADTTAVAVTVLPSPEVSFAHTAFGCQGDTLWLQNTSPDLAGSVWHFGDGASDSTRTSPGHVYADTGMYTITLTGVSATYGCTASTSKTIEVKPLPAPSAFVLDSFGCQPFTFRAVNTSNGTGFYVWDFGDGGFSTEFSPTHTFAEAGLFTVRLEMTDLFGCTNTWSYAPVNVYPRPEARFGYDKNDLCTTPAVIRFDNQSLDADSYVWDFGPFGGSALVHPSISVPERTTLRVGLVAATGFGCRDTVVQDLEVYTAPALDFGVEDARGCSPLAVLFENASFGVNRYAWDFGDGSTSGEAQPLHVYEQPGVYPVTLYASMDSVCFDSLRFDNLATVLISPTAGFGYEELTDTTVSPNGIIRFLDMSVNATRWRWDFGDGDSSNLQHPVHRYGVNGPRIVTLIAANGTGCTDTARVEIVPEVFGALYIPNALSPDAGDPGARYFQPRGAGLAEFEIAVFASNGQRVWHSTRLENGMPVEYWDGTFEGAALPQGLYWWKGRGRYVDGRLWQGMSYDGSPGQTEGKVMLLR
ncbi:MAG: PKD domain-containing protein [Saprospiraceae bacterium]|nr:PKD domain-containing protein [Saprospiraceae bacterium]